MLWLLYSLQTQGARRLVMNCRSTSNSDFLKVFFCGQLLDSKAWNPTYVRTTFTRQTMDLKEFEKFQTLMGLCNEIFSLFFRLKHFYGGPYWIVISTIKIIIIDFLVHSQGMITGEGGLPWRRMPSPGIILSKVFRRWWKLSFLEEGCLRHVAYPARSSATDGNCHF